MRKDWQELYQERILVVGAGPAGLMAALMARRQGQPVLLIEGSREFSKKLLMTGNGRCNLTHLLPLDELLDCYYGAGPFLRPALSQFDPEAVMAFFEASGLPLKVEPNQRVYPASQQARDVRNVLLDQLRRAGVELQKNCRLLALEPLTAEQGEAPLYRVELTSGPALFSTIVLAGGGRSYPQSGSDGSVWAMLEQLGLELLPPEAALTALPLRNVDKTLQGRALQDVELSYGSGQKRYRCRGDLLWTAQGISGPAVLNLSGALPLNRPLDIHLRLAASLAPAERRAQVAALFQQAAERRLKNVNWPGLNYGLSTYCLRLAGLDPERSWHSYPQPLQAVEALYAPLTLALGPAPALATATVTRGGLALRELSPRSLELKAFPGLFAAGELLNLHGECGGFNLQAAWATGHLAGNSAAAYFATVRASKSPHEVQA